MREGVFFFFLFFFCAEELSLFLCRADTHLYAQTAGLALLVDSALSAGPTEHIGAHFALALQLLGGQKHAVGCFLQVSHTWRCCSSIYRPL